jgi:hypothetical protein
MTLTMLSKPDSLVFVAGASAPNIDQATAQAQAQGYTVTSSAQATAALLAWRSSLQTATQTQAT